METDSNSRGKLEVCLVHRKRLADTAAIFYANVVGAGTACSRRFLKVLHDTNVKESLFLDEYLLMGIEWKPDAMTPLDFVKIDNDQEAQNEGYEVVCHILEQEGVEEEFQLEEGNKEQPEMMKLPRGPKRVETILINKQDPLKKVKLVVVECLPPKGPFKCHTLKGRAWIDATERLEIDLNTYISDHWWVSQVVKYVDPGSSVSSFHGIQDIEAWGKIEGFLGNMQASEINVVRHFKYHHDKENEYPAACRHQQSARGVPKYYRNPYTPEVVFFRVSGDEVGEKAFLVQTKKQVKNWPGPPTLKEFLEEAEKKAVAGDESDSEEASSAVSDFGDPVSGGSKDSATVDSASSNGGSGGGDSNGTGSTRLPPHNPELDSLEDDPGFAFGDIPFVPELDGAPQSGLERSLHHFPGPCGWNMQTARGRKKKTLH